MFSIFSDFYTAIQGRVEPIFLVLSQSLQAITNFNDVEFRRFLSDYSCFEPIVLVLNGNIKAVMISTVQFS